MDERADGRAGQRATRRPAAPAAEGAGGGRERRDGGAARLRAAIDSGRTGDKVDAADPAAAPLGTDDEAAGTPPPRPAPPADQK